MKELKADYGWELRFCCLNQGSSSGLEDNVSSDGLVDKASLVPASDDVVFSLKKKVKTNRPLGITPAIDKMGLQGETEYDSAFNNLFDSVDMDAFMDIDEEEVKLVVNGNVKKEAQEALRSHWDQSTILGKGVFQEPSVAFCLWLVQCNQRRYPQSPKLSLHFS